MAGIWIHLIKHPITFDRDFANPRVITVDP